MVLSYVIFPSCAEGAFDSPTMCCIYRLLSSSGTLCFFLYLTSIASIHSPPQKHQWHLTPCGFSPWQSCIWFSLLSVVFLRCGIGYILKHLVIPACVRTVLNWHASSNHHTGLCWSSQLDSGHCIFFAVAIHKICSVQNQGRCRDQLHWPVSLPLHSLNPDLWPWILSMRENVLQRHVTGDECTRKCDTLAFNAWVCCWWWIVTWSPLIDPLLRQLLIHKKNKIIGLYI